MFVWGWNPQNSEISLEFEGSEARIVKFHRNLKVLGILAGRAEESLSRVAKRTPAGAPKY